MIKYKVFVSTCSDVNMLDKEKKKCDALDLPKKWSKFDEIEAESLDDAFDNYCKTQKFNDFINCNYGEIHYFYLENGIPVLYK